VLLVLQAMPAAGKDETIRAALRGLNPQAYKTVHFAMPNDEEQAHDHLWRFHHRAPEVGIIGVFNRSQLEGVVSDRVEQRVPEERWRRRYGHIRDFERMLTDEGTTFVKAFLHVSIEEERRRLRGRAEDPERRWELDLHDLDILERHEAFQEAYEDAIRETSTEHAPWDVVPADVPIVRDAAVLTLLRDTLRELDPQVPTDALDDDELAEVRERLGDGPTSDPASELDRAR
ncbi:MAG: polyphosphate kinase 2 family protein, partial [Actinobacteria bacterium]|nr:polyphosphate kinase 2 family protein [Actinomycetota bacterium]